MEAIIPARSRCLFAIIRPQDRLQKKMHGKAGRESQAMKALTIAAAALALMAMPAQAQMGGKQASGRRYKRPTSRTKKVDDKAYKAALERIPDPKEKYDPWGVTKPADPPEEAEITGSEIQA